MSAADRTTQRILVVDDNEAIHDDLRKALSSREVNQELDELEQVLFGSNATSDSAAKYEIDSAFQGEEGIKKVRTALEDADPYMLAFVDMRMPPGIDGVETIERMWRIDDQIQIIVCTAYTDYSWDEMIERLGLTDRLLIIKKPFDQAEVCQAAAAMSEKWKLTQQARLKLNDLQQLADQRTEELKDSNQRLHKEIATRKAAEEQLRHDAFHDPLTLLPNRALFIDRLGAAIERRQADEDFQFAVLFFDIDDFKVINDSLGHSVGDQVLIMLSQRLNGCIRSVEGLRPTVVDTTGRLGGDEFVVLIEGIEGPDDALRVADRIRERIEEPMEVDGNSLAISSSIGITLSDTGGDNAEDYLRDADTAMYRAKAHGKARYSVFNRAMHREAMERLRLETDLRGALARDEFRLVYQPIVEMASGHVSGFEALIRWDRPGDGLVTPDRFVHVAEERGLIVPIGAWVLTEACQQLAEWQRISPDTKDLTINVNISKRQISEPGLVELVARTIEEYGIDPTDLALEVTESGIMENSAGISTILNDLGDLGVRVQMDDFGTGYSSLSCLHQYPLEALKIDRSFLNTMAGNRDYAAVIFAIMSLAHNLNMQVTAEGVETAEQVALLLALECDYAQGFYFAPAMEPAAAQRLLRAGVPWRKSA
ncbi:MAG: two-component system response regulator [Planctomycetota bacterium]|jgi:diguanylate cyclase (GGDEF)-like protein